MKFLGEIRGVKPDGANTKTLIEFYGSHAAELEGFPQSKPLQIEIKEHRKKRSLSANALCWELCSIIGRAIQPPLPKETVYRDAIKAVGKFEELLIREEAVEAFARRQEAIGIGWFVEIVGEAPLRGYTDVIAYIGSSVYDTKEMSVLIDYLIDTARQMGIPINEEEYTEWKAI